MPCYISSKCSGTLLRQNCAPDFNPHRVLGREAVSCLSSPQTSKEDPWRSRNLTKLMEQPPREDLNSVPPTTKLIFLQSKSQQPCLSVLLTLQTPPDYLHPVPDENGLSGPFCTRSTVAAWDLSCLFQESSHLPVAQMSELWVSNVAVHRNDRQRSCSVCFQQEHPGRSL